MKTRNVLQGDNARTPMIDGMAKLSLAVSATLGPKGRFVGIDQQGKIIVTKDGVSVAKEVVLRDKAENFGAGLIKQAAQKTNEEAGDGTTTSTVLATSIIVEGFTKLAKGTTDPQKLRSELIEAKDKVIDLLKEFVVPVEKKLGFVAAISANDEKMGTMVKDAIEKVGKNGVVMIDTARGFEDELIFEEGMRLKRGLPYPEFATDKSTGKLAYKDAKVFVSTGEILQPSDIIPLLEYCAERKSPLVVFAPSISDEVLILMMANNLQGGQRFVGIPFTVIQPEETLADLAAFTGATLVDRSFVGNDISPEVLGSVESFRSEKNLTVLRGGAGDVSDRLAKLHEESKEDLAEFRMKANEERLANLDGGIAVIKVSAKTEAELIEKKDRYEDAVNATKSSLEEGIVPGGGSTLVLVSTLLEATTEGERVLLDAMKMPLAVIACNAGFEGEAVVEKVIAEKKGFNALTGKFEDLLKAGVVDPFKVIRCAIENSVSVAATALVLEGIIVDEREEDNSCKK